MLALAHKRIADRPDKYVDHIYGEKELGGTSVVYLSAVPFEKLGFPTYGEKPFPAFTSGGARCRSPGRDDRGRACSVPRTPSSGSGLRRWQTDAAASKHSGDHGHVEFEPLRNKLMTPFNWVLLLLMAFGGVSFVARFALGLGGSTHLSDTYPWGLWILFDLVWIAVAAGAFAMAGVIYVFQRKDLYGLGRTAVLMGLLSYSFVTVTLVADLGLPWHSYALALQRSGTLGHVRGLVVRRPLRHDPPARVPAGSLRALGIPAGRGGLAAMERRLRGGGGDAVRLSAFAQPRSTPSRRP